MMTMTTMRTAMTAMRMRMIILTSKMISWMNMFSIEGSGAPKGTAAEWKTLSHTFRTIVWSLPSPW